MCSIFPRFTEVDLTGDEELVVGAERVIAMVFRCGVRFTTECRVERGSQGEMKDDEASFEENESAIGAEETKRSCAIRLGLCDEDGGE